MHGSFFSFFKRTEQPIVKPAYVRVLLDTIELPLKKPVFIKTVGKHIELASAKAKTSLTETLIPITIRRGSFVIKGKTYPSPVVCKSEGHLMYTEKSYQGLIQLLIKDNTLLVINQVPLEDYICSVLKTESWPGWPLEVNKVFAITSRTYALYMIGQAQKTQGLYDVHNTKKHQTYSGVHDTQILHDAVEQTKGMILTYEGKPILAMFDSCCGGIIPARMLDVNFDEAPYLARTYPCTHCKSCWIFNWKSSLTAKDLAERLFKDKRNKPHIRSLHITKKDPAGLIREIEINIGAKMCMTGKEFYAALGEVKSFAYTIKKEKDSFVFQGRGYGHHIGLCQWGAREAVRAGWHYKRILQFYYPGARLAELT